MLVIVPEKLSKEETNKTLGKYVDSYTTIINTDADVYTTDGKLLLKFRKNVIEPSIIKRAVEALGSFVFLKSTDRGTAGASEKGLGTGQKRPIKSNILGYFDRYTISQKGKFKKDGTKPTEPCRPCRWNRDHPEEWKNDVVPFIQEIDKNYKSLCPEEHALQLEAASKTKYRVEGTAFSTVTVNHNFRTAGHYDKGDFTKGFGNLVVYEKGSYKGGYIGFPKYDIAVNVRTGDFLAMDVHQLHANTALEVDGVEPPERISFVSYFREAILKKNNV